MFASRETVPGGAGGVDLAFTDREGGVSARPFDSLNLSGSGVAATADVAANFAALAEAFEVESFAVMRQAHGNEVCVLDAAPVGARQPDAAEASIRPRLAVDTVGECDAVITTVPGVALCVRVADCVPILMADTERGVVGAVHAGREGIVAGVVESAVRAMRGRGADHIAAWVGPYVCAGCYEVPAELREAVAAHLPTVFACTTWGTPSVDLGAAVQAQLAAAGCTVHDRSRCTRESPDLYSYRRDGADSGRGAGVIVLRPR